MIIDAENDKLVFSTGKVVSCYAGVVGIEPGLSAREGYDGYLDLVRLTRAEKVELADAVIDLWQRYKAQAADDEGTA